jgi:large subunit ribosomal protein L35
MAGCKKSRGDKPKLKTKRSAAKRFSVTASGLVKHASKGRRHCLNNNSRKRKRQLVKGRYMTKMDAGLVERLIPYLV